LILNYLSDDVRYLYGLAEHGFVGVNPDILAPKPYFVAFQNTRPIRMAFAIVHVDDVTRNPEVGVRDIDVRRDIAARIVDRACVYTDEAPIVVFLDLFSVLERRNLFQMLSLALQMR
jgi:hypothetical protein